jgi:hypothetical protein
LVISHEISAERYFKVPHLGHWFVLVRFVNFRRSTLRCFPIYQFYSNFIIFIFFHFSPKTFRNYIYSPFFVQVIRSVQVSVPYWSICPRVCYKVQCHMAAPDWSSTYTRHYKSQSSQSKIQQHYSFFTFPFTFCHVTQPSNNFLSLFSPSPP